MWLPSKRPCRRWLVGLVAAEDLRLLQVVDARAWPVVEEEEEEEEDKEEVMGGGRLRPPLPTLTWRCLWLPRRLPAVTHSGPLEEEEEEEEEAHSN